ncbi:MAG: cysteine hydrolase [Alcaligenaceae bacterium]|nr:cysteine hydrolase [Alcaligenaceae bacterium]
MNQAFDPKKTAVLSLHLVNDIVSPEGKFGPFFAAQVQERKVLDHAARLLERARAAGMLVVHAAVRFKPGHVDLVANSPLLTMVRDMDALVEGTWGADFAQGVQPQADEPVITHQRVGAFHETGLDALLKSRGIEHLILQGVVTNNIVEHSARDAVDRGYYVTVVDDCCSAPAPEVHAASIGNLGLLAQVVSLDDCLSRLKP